MGKRPHIVGNVSISYPFHCGGVGIIRNGICVCVGVLKEMNKIFYFNHNCSILFTCSERGQLGYTSSESVTRFIHQILFIPVLFRPGITSKGLSYSNKRVKIRDSRWTPFVSWAWLVRGISRVNYVVRYLQVATISSAIVIFLMGVFQ